MTKEEIIGEMTYHLTALQQLVFEAEEILDWDENIILGQVNDGIHRARVAVTKIERHQTK